MPFDGSVERDDTGDDPTEEERESKLEPLVDGHAMCTHGVRTVYHNGRSRWRSIVAYVDGGLIPPHGNIRRPTQIPEHDPRMPPVRAHFEDLNVLHKYDVKALLAVSKMTRGGNFDVSLKENKTDVVWLPPSAEIRSLYYRYALSQGWMVIPKKDGQVYQPVDDSLPTSQRKALISMCTFVRVWQRDYAKLKVRADHEDVCAMCVKFHNRHQSLAVNNTCPVAARDLDEWEKEDIFGILDNDPTDGDCSGADKTIAEGKPHGGQAVRPVPTVGRERR